MNTNRLVRDDILNRALDMVDSLTLNEKERPGGAIHANAMSQYWLQDAIDLFHRAFPWTGLLTTTPISLSNSTNSYSQPTDMTMDMRDGLRIVQSSPRVIARLRRKSYSWLLNQDTTNVNLGQPAYYVLVGDTIRVVPWPNTTYTAELSYYKLPSVLAPNARPSFPDDWTLVEYVRLRGQEWLREEEPGTAMKYARVVIGELKKSGLGEESERDALELDPTQFRPTGSGGGEYSSWLGDAVPR